MTLAINLLRHTHSGSLYHNNRPLELLVPQAAPEGESEAADDFPDEIIVWARAKDIMKGILAVTVLLSLCSSKSLITHLQKRERQELK